MVSVRGANKCGECIHLPRGARHAARVRRQPREAVGPQYPPQTPRTLCVGTHPHFDFLTPTWPPTGPQCLGLARGHLTVLGFFPWPYPRSSRRPHCGMGGRGDHLGGNHRWNCTCRSRTTTDQRSTKIVVPGVILHPPHPN